MNLVKVLSGLDQAVLGKSRVVESIKFGDGKYFMSVQASYAHYCTPRKTLDFGEYTHFEIMTNIPNGDIPSRWIEYGDGDSIFGWVPKEEIEALLNVLNEKYGIDNL